MVPDNIVLLHLPPDSPELNPKENVWGYLRQNKLCALVWDSYDDIVEACKTAWNWLIAIQHASPRSACANGRVSVFRRVGMILFPNKQPRDATDLHSSHSTVVVRL